MKKLHKIGVHFLFKPPVILTYLEFCKQKFWCVLFQSNEIRNLFTQEKANGYRPLSAKAPPLISVSPEDTQNTLT